MYPACFLLLVSLTGCLWATFEALVFRNWSESLSSQASTIETFVRILWLAIGWTSIWLLECRRRRLGLKALLTERSALFHFRLSSYSLISALIVTSLAYEIITQTPERIQPFFISVAGLHLCLAELFKQRVPKLEASRSTPSRILGIYDLACMNLLLLLALLESALTFAREISNTPIFWSELSTVEKRIDSQRWPPGKYYFNTRLNSRGYHDEEFFVANSNDLAVALIGDSFGMGIVPYDFNFVTIAEKKLQESLAGKYNRIAIHNLSIPGINLPEYLHLLEEEALGLNPNLFVISLFVGNDIDSISEYATASRINRLAFQNWFSWKIPQRLYRLAKEDSLYQQEIVHANLDPNKVLQEIGHLEAGESHLLPEYLFDEGKEPPTLSNATFMEIERHRLEVCNSQGKQNEEAYDLIFKALDYLNETVGEKLVLLLVPDEYQVNDSLWTDLLATVPDSKAYRRELPQQKIIQHCQRHEIKYIDLLPILREAEKMQRTYHLRNTHFNAYGNKVVGSVLADVISHHEVVLKDQAPAKQ